MLKIRFIVVDRTRSPFLRKGESFYLERLKKYAKIEWIEVKPAEIKKGRSEQDVLIAEGQNISRRLSRQDYLISMDRKGHQYDSEGLADYLKGLATSVNGWTCFVIGGPLGLSGEILDRSDKKLSLSRMTLTHEMCRIFLVEQVYRAFTIMAGTKYHK
ncbi:23S rRNA (pseudouridine(1915)-N(3))-methyltransferase RlmH [Thermodesulfobacteriota bacterium]